MSLTRLVYASESRLVEANRHQELSRIVSSAQRLNRQHAVTGYLLVTPGAFAQVLEGDHHNVVETYGRITVDLRHTNVRLLSEEPVERRDFADWSMGFAERDQTTAFIFDLHGITPEADLPAQPVEVLLDLAGELARHAPDGGIAMLKRRPVRLDLARNRPGPRPDLSRSTTEGKAAFALCLAAMNRQASLQSASAICSCSIQPYFKI